MSCRSHTFTDTWYKVHCTVVNMLQVPAVNGLHWGTRNITPRLVWCPWLLFGCIAIYTVTVSFYVGCLYVIPCVSFLWLFVYCLISFVESLPSYDGSHMLVCVCGLWTLNYCVRVFRNKWEEGARISANDNENMLHVVSRKSCCMTTLRNYMFLTYTLWLKSPKRIEYIKHVRNLSSDQII